FYKQCLDRLPVSIHAKGIRGKAATCDNVKCQKVDAKKNLRKCSGRGTVLYCSKECTTMRCPSSPALFSSARLQRAPWVYRLYRLHCFADQVLLKAFI
ncbi:hypothetical protein EDD18DRAFT_1068207, partial [Armillaria luteobubalina]